MTKEEVIKSGMLEQYASGLLSAEEEADMNKYFRKWPELRRHIVEMQEMLDEVGGDYDLLSKQDHFSAGRVVRMKNGVAQAGSSTSWRSITTIFGLLILVLGGAVGYFFYKNRNANEAVDAMQAKLTKLKTNLNEGEEKTAELSKNYQFFVHPQTVSIHLKPLLTNFDGNITAYYNAEAKRTCLSIYELPDPPANKIYQIWADVDHEMKNLGVLSNATNSLIELPYIANAESFNITLEPTGGSSTPTVEELVMNGKVIF